MVGVIVVMPHAVWKSSQYDDSLGISWRYTTYRALHTTCHCGTDRLSDRLHSHSGAAALELDTIYVDLAEILSAIFIVTGVWGECAGAYSPTSSYRRKYCKESRSRSWP